MFLLLLAAVWDIVTLLMDESGVSIYGFHRELSQIKNLLLRQEKKDERKRAKLEFGGEATKKTDQKQRKRVGRIASVSLCVMVLKLVRATPSSYGM